jgi:hypothetical protein
MIPKIIHYVWVGGPLPSAQADYIASWRETNPDFEVICWNEQNIDMSSEIICRAYKSGKWAKVADIARLQAVATMGGVYLDTDFRVYKSLTSMLGHRCFFAFQGSSISADWVSNGVFGAEPGHWFIKQARDGLHAMRPNLFLPERPTAFGPKHITRLMRRAGLKQYSSDGVMVQDIFVAATPVFFPFSHRESFTPSCVKAETLAAHFWEKSWGSTVPAPVRLAKACLEKMTRMRH